MPTLDATCPLVTKVHNQGRRYVAQGRTLVLIVDGLKDLFVDPVAASIEAAAFSLGGGRPFFQDLPEHVRLRLLEAVQAPGVTHLRYEVIR